MIVQQRVAVESVGEDEKTVLMKMQEILYATEEGFEVRLPLGLSSRKLTWQLPEEGLDANGQEAEEEETF